MRQIFGRDLHQCENPWDNAPAWAVELGAISLILIEKMEAIMALSPQVQALVDAVAANTSAVKAATDGLALEATQIADLKAQIAAITPGQAIDQEDLDAITKAVADLSATNTALQSAVPANVKSA